MKPAKRKRQKTLEDDRISSLPDDLLCRILSLLNTKLSVSTTILATRWKNLFASVPILDFDDSLSGSGTPDVISFSSFVTETLSAVLMKLLYVRKFHLRCEKGTYPASLVGSWISVVSSCNLEDLCVYTKDLTNPVALPPKLFSCSALTVLRLRGNFFFSVPEQVIFPSLKKLELSDLVLMDDESVKRFFKGCIVLEELGLWRCVIDMIIVLEVSVASLKRLNLDINGDYAFFLDAPRLKYFSCYSYATGGYFGDKLKSLDSAYIDMSLEDEHFEDHKVSQLMNMVSNASTFCLSSDSLEPLIYETTTFQNLTEVRVSTRRAGGWLSLPDLLRNAPRLEVLSFEHGLRDEDGIYLESASYLPDPVPVCVSDHLKEVEVGYFQGEEYEYELVQYFLMNAKVLKKMIINPSPSYESIKPSVCRMFSMKEQLPITKRLLKLPRCSRACQIDFGDILY